MNEFIDSMNRLKIYNSAEQKQSGEEKEENKL